MNVLHIDSSILGQDSATRELSAAIVARLRHEAPQARVTYRDLAATPIPHLSAGSLAGAEAFLAATVMDEFLDADVVVVGAPMYNFGIPSQLKAWIDRIAVRGKTFRYTPEGPVGMALGKKLIVAAAYGGAHPAGGASNFVEPYLRFMFRFLGVEDIAVIAAEGLSMSSERREASIAAARAVIASAGTTTRLAA